MKVAAIQHDIEWEDAPATLARVTPMIASAAAAGARLIVLPEMFATGFSMHPERIAEPESSGLVEEFLRARSAEHGVHLAASIAQQGADGQYRNNLVLTGPQGTVARYAKIHPFGYAGEDKVYRAGDGFVTVLVEDVRVSLFVCYDLRFADEFWVRALDTDLYLVPANWPESRREHWRALLRARAIENQAYVLGVNRVGVAGVSRPLAHAGDSVVLDPLGIVLAEGGDGETVLLAEVDAAVVADVRKKLPFLPDRRQFGHFTPERSSG